MLTGCSICMGGSVDCSDWPRADCAVDFSPGGGGGGVWIGYIRPGLWNDLLIDAGISSDWNFVVQTLSYLLDLCCTSGGLATAGIWQRTVPRWQK